MKPIESEVIKIPAAVFYQFTDVFIVLSFCFYLFIYLLYFFGLFSALLIEELEIDRKQDEREGEGHAAKGPWPGFNPGAAHSTTRAKWRLRTQFLYFQTDFLIKETIQQKHTKLLDVVGN